jgi:hypothetical protein
LPLVVVDQELLTPYLFETKVPTLSYRKLEELFETHPGAGRVRLWDDLP